MSININIDENVLLVGEKVITLFLILFAGLAARKLNIIDWAVTKKLSAFLINITMPLLIITSFQLDFDSEILKNGLMIFVVSAVLHIFISAAAYFLYKPVKNSGHKKIYEMSTVFGNCLFLGYPVLKVVFGDEIGVFYGVFYGMFFNLYLWTYGLYLITRKNKKEKNSENSEESKESGKFKIPTSKIFFNIGIISSVTGIIIFISGIKIPGVIYGSAKLVGDMTFPLSMVIIGSLISEIKLKEMFLNFRNYYFVFIKLIFLPVFVALVCYVLKLPVLLIYIGTLMTAMPSAANVAIFAETYGADSKAAAINAGLTTLVSIGTIPVIMYLLDNILKLKL